MATKGGAVNPIEPRKNQDVFKLKTPNPKDPQAEPCAHCQHAQQQLITELLEAKKTYITELRWKHAASEEAVPVSLLEQKLKDLGGQGE